MLTRRTFLSAASAALLAPRAVQAAIVTDDAGRTIPVPNKVHRVLPAGPAAAVLIYTLAPDLLLGWPRANRPEECAFLLPNICARPAIGRLAGRGNTIDLESVFTFRPSLIVDVGATGGADIALADRVQQQTGIPYALLDGRLYYLSTSYEKLGQLMGRTADGTDFAEYTNMTIGVVTNRTAFVPAEKRPRVYYARGRNGLTTALGGAINVESIEIMARNVAGETQGGIANVTIEQVRAWSPDVIVTIDQDFAHNVYSDPAWAPIAAVKDRRVHIAPRLPFGWLELPPSANRLIGLWWLGKLFYPDLFNKYDMRELTREYYDKFYHVTPTAAQIDRVLAGP